jgi:hypothetical protein
MQSGECQLQRAGPGGSPGRVGSPGLEAAAGYEQLSMFDGWTPERIAGRVGRPVEHVRPGLAAAKVSAEL